MDWLAGVVVFVLGCMTGALLLLMAQSRAGLCAVLALLAAPAYALDAPGVPSPVSGPAPVKVHAVLGSVVSAGGDADTAVRPFALLLVDLPLSSAAMGPRLVSDIQLGAKPGEAVSLSDAATFREVAFRSVLTQQLARALRFSVYAGVGFSTRLGSDPEPVERAARWWSAGVRFSGERGVLELGFGQDERLGHGYQPTAHVRGALLLGSPRGINAYLVGEALLALQIGYAAADRTDVVTAGVAMGR